MPSQHNPYHRNNNEQQWQLLWLVRGRGGNNILSKTRMAIGIAVLVCLGAILSDAYHSSSASAASNSLYNAEMAAAAAHSDATLALAKKESAEHMAGMDELYDEMRNRPLIVKAYALADPNAPPEAMTVHFVRHGQGFHNLMADIRSASGVEWVQYSQTPENPYIMPEILDAPLTEKGRQQALLLQSTVKAMSTKPQLVVLSPNCRALQTGILVFEELIHDEAGGGGGVPFVAHEMVREEHGVHVCDKRRPTSRQIKEFPQVDFSLLETEEDVLFQNDHRETKAEVGERVYKFMEWLSQRSEKHVGIASHSGWLLTVFNGICECDNQLKGWFQTGEMRSVKLEFIQK